MVFGSAIRTDLSRRTRRALAVLVLALVLPVFDAAADTRICRQLEAELASTPAGGGAGTRVKRYDEAIATQRQQIDKARSQARRAGCGFAVVGRNVSACGEINATLERMRRNLADLQAKRARMGNGGDNRRERARILAALDVNGCRARQRPLPEPVDGGSRVQAVIDGRTGLRIGGLSGRFRTLCVRTCDGYYFPLSYSVTSGAFERDAKACDAMCPGTEVELHYHRVPGEESQDMVSAVTGKPYAELEHAFLYRDANMSVPKSCGCGAEATRERGFEVIGGSHGNGIVEEDDTAAALPRPSERPDPAEDPETAANRDGGLDASSIIELATPPPPEPEKPAPAAAPRPLAAPADRDVRVVGPTFLPDPGAAIDLRVPDQPVAR